MQSGLLIANNDFSVEGVDSLLRHISALVSEKIYILLRSPLCQQLCEYTWKKYISLYYSSANHVSFRIFKIYSQVCPDLGVYVFLPRTSIVNTNRVFQVIVTDETIASNEEIIEFANPFGNISDGCPIYRHKVG